MIVEVATISIWCLSGAALLHALGMRGSILAALGFLLGSAMHCCIAVVQLVFRAPVHPLVTLACTALIAAGVGFAANRRSGWRPPLRSALLLALTVPAAVLLRELSLLGWHTDTFRYLEAAILIGSDRADLLTLDLLEKRMAAFVIVLAPATVAGETHLRSFCPLLGVACAWVLAWVLWRAPRSGNRVWVGVCIAVSLMLLLSNNRFLWHLGYINGHLLFAVHVLVLAGIGWLQVQRESALPVGAFIVLQATSAIVVALDRPEGPLVAIVALVPFVCCAQFNRRERFVPFVALAVALITWYTHLALVRIENERPPPASTLGIAGIGLCMLAFAALSEHQAVFRKLKHIPLAVEVALWAAVAFFVLRSPDILLHSLRSMAQNFLEHGASWGSSVWILTLLLTCALLFTRSPARLYLRYPITTFVPLSLLFAYLRQMPYRDGDRDSLSRMLMHIFPLAVLLLASCLFAQWRWAGPLTGERAARHRFDGAATSLAHAPRM
jgi:hypothetical protein